jgi:hypothetical protein
MASFLEDKNCSACYNLHQVSCAISITNYIDVYELFTIWLNQFSNGIQSMEFNHDGISVSKSEYNHVNNTA